MRILVVEDDREIASFVAKGLRQASYAVDVVADGEEGLDRALGDISNNSSASGRSHRGYRISVREFVRDKSATRSSTGID